MVGLWKTSLPLRIWLADCSSLLPEATIAERLAWLGSRLCTYESLLSCPSWPSCRFLLWERRLSLKLRRGDSPCRMLSLTSKLRLVNGRKASKLLRGRSRLGRELGEEPWTGDNGESVALTPSLIFAVRTTRLAAWSLLPLVLVLLDDCASELGSAWSLGPCAWDDESSIMILRTLMASFPKLKKEKKYCACQNLVAESTPSLGRGQHKPRR